MTDVEIATIPVWGFRGRPKNTANAKLRQELPLVGQFVKLWLASAQDLPVVTMSRVTRPVLFQGGVHEDLASGRANSIFLFQGPMKTAVS